MGTGHHEPSWSQWEVEVSASGWLKAGSPKQRALSEVALPLAVGQDLQAEH